jgi:hypothetical protein
MLSQWQPLPDPGRWCEHACLGGGLGRKDDAHCARATHSSTAWDGVRGTAQHNKQRSVLLMRVARKVGVSQQTPHNC